ncbi:unnamed protein product, partial [Arabidopsis halleri]
MDKITGLPDDLLLKILSFLPTEVAVSTSILSKRWEFLWMWLPRLEFISPKPELRDFIDKKLPLLRAPFLAMYVSWKFLMLWEMKTYYRTLQLEKLIFVDGLQQLLSICPVLEQLSVDFYEYDKTKEFSISIPSLQSLSLFLRSNKEYLDSYEIDTPSLKYLKLVDWSYKEHYSLIKNMPKLTEAYVDVVSLNPKSVIGSITSAKRLTICSFEELEHLNLCVCKLDSWNLLVQLLKGSPNLRVLDIFVKKVSFRSGIVCWDKPSSVPECLLSSLQIFNWSGYLGRPQARDIAVYILKNACHLKKATILVDTREIFVTKLQMTKELTLCPRASSTCQ